MPMNDRGLVTDATGEGMAGATDVSFQTQQELKQTTYIVQVCFFIHEPGQS